MALQPGFYWYKGPFVLNGKVTEHVDTTWYPIEVNDDGSISYIGTYSDGDKADVEMMEKIGKFVPIQPPKDLK